MNLGISFSPLVPAYIVWVAVAVALALALLLVFGRTRVWKRVDASGKVVSGVRQLPRQQWAVLIPGHHPGFITWEKYEANTTRLRANM